MTRATIVVARLAETVSERRGPLARNRRNSIFVMQYVSLDREAMRLIIGYSF